MEGHHDQHPWRHGDFAAGQVTISPAAVGHVHKIPANFAAGDGPR